MSIPSTAEKDPVAETLEDGAGRYAVFANRFRTAMTAGLRYSAYSSELGEAFRPLTKPIVVRSLYGISWTYVIGDVAYAGYKARNNHRELSEQRMADPLTKTKDGIVEKTKELAAQTKHLANSAANGTAVADVAAAAVQGHAHGQHADPLEHSENAHVALICARRAVFQSLASMALPAFTVHSIVHYSQPLFKGIQNHKVRAIGPTILGLAIIPALPVIFDEPVEHVIDAIFDWGEANLLPKSNGRSSGSSSTQSDGTAAPGKASTALPFAAALGVGLAGVGLRRRMRWGPGAGTSAATPAAMPRRAPPPRS